MLEGLKKLFRHRGDRALGEIAWADPLNLFPGSGQFPQFNPSDLVGRKGLRIFDDMRKDDQVKAALNLKKYAILAPEWELAPPRGQTEDAEVVAFTRDNLMQMEHRFEDTLWEVLLALDYGFSVSEKVFTRRDGMVHLLDLKGRKPHTMNFRVDIHGNITGLDQENTDLNDLSPDKFVIYTFQKQFGNPYGISDLEAAFSAYWGKINTYKWMMMYLERFGIPPLFGFYDPSSYTEQQIEDLKSVLEKMQASTTGLIPRSDEEAFEPWLPNSQFAQTQTQRQFIPALDRQDQMIARALLMPGLIGLTPEGRNGSFARAETNFGTFMIVVEFLQQQLADIINHQIIGPLVKMNFDTDEAPQFRWLPLTDDTKLSIANSWAELVKVGAVASNADDDRHIRRIHGFPEGGNTPPGPDNTGDDEDQ